MGLRCDCSRQASRGSLSRGSRGRDSGGLDSGDHFPPGPDEEDEDEEEDESVKAYQEQLAALRGEGIGAEVGRALFGTSGDGFFPCRPLTNTRRFFYSSVL